MVNRVVPIVLIAVLALLHSQLWFGRGSVPDVKQMQRRIEALKESNAQAQRVNERLTSEVEDLKAGLDMVEEKARSELGMVKPNEILVQIAR
ncbi:FtsB family cell division protein [Xylophilus sp. ASV27]|uniref:FtsB family cell division protein n=1 Tax=Xylophilus sp. ASV27 TaxID=2795129 RepID=UPI0018EBDE6A|nr:septum formation initiator family protein [Xylophilus sp. ASV27]